MAKLMDLLSASIEIDSQFDGAWCVRFAFALNMGVKQAQDLFERYGEGYVYSPTGFVMPDSPRVRAQFASHFDKCVVVDADGKTWTKVKGSVNKWHILKVRKEKAIERRQIKRELEARKIARETDKVFRAGQTHPSKKRQGKGDSMDAIGNYVPRYRASIYDSIPIVKDVYHVIKVEC